MLALVLVPLLRRSQVIARIGPGGIDAPRAQPGGADCSAADSVVRQKEVSQGVASSRPAGGRPLLGAGTVGRNAVRACLGAGAFGIGHVLDIASGEDPARGRAQRRPGYQRLRLFQRRGRQPDRHVRLLAAQHRLGQVLYGLAREIAILHIAVQFSGGIDSDLLIDHLQPAHLFPEHLSRVNEHHA